MKLYYYLIFFSFIFGCSFDNKTGIWNNQNTLPIKKESKIFEDFKKISVSKEPFETIISLSEDESFEIDEPIINEEWKDIYFSKNNGLKNFSYQNSNQIFFKSRKLSKKKINEYKLFEKDNLIVNDNKGNLIIYSTKKEIIISKFNFYKKKFKKIDKILNVIVENSIIYVSDNLGYLYAYDYKKKKVIWAKNFKIPFNSNLKIYKNKIITSNQNNNLYIVNKNNGDLIKSIPTEEFYLKNKFKNSLSINNSGELFYLNSFGSLYSINLELNKVNWFNNFNQSTNFSLSNSFEGNKVLSTDKFVLISSKLETFLIDTSTGSIIQKFNFSSVINPIIIKDYVFFLSKNNFIIALDLKYRNIVFSTNIRDFVDFNFDKNKNDIYKKMMFLNNDIFIFLNNSKVINLSKRGVFKKIYQLPSKIKSSPISIDKFILFVNNKNKLVILG